MRGMFLVDACWGGRVFRIVDAFKHAFMSIPGSERNPHACHMIQGGRCRLAPPKLGDVQIQDNPTPIPLQPVAMCMTSSAAAILLLYGNGCKCADDILCIWWQDFFLTSSASKGLQSTASEELSALSCADDVACFWQPSEG